MGTNHTLSLLSEWTSTAFKSQTTTQKQVVWEDFINIHTEVKKQVVKWPFKLKIEIPSQSSQYYVRVVLLLGWIRWSQLFVYVGQ